MTVSLRPAQIEDCTELSALCLRSKGHWDYDDVFLNECRAELTVTPDDISKLLVVAGFDGQLAGVAQIGPLEENADLLLLFVDPPFMGQGIGRVLFDWCIKAAQGIRAKNLMIDADPGAEAFYKRLGAVRVGENASASVPGRMLPLLKYKL